MQPKYIHGFDLHQTREMVKKLGRIIGITFDETIYTRLTEDYGGHPFLIRRVCSFIAQKHKERPVTIDRNKYIEAREIFNKQTDYFNMLLEVLMQFYPDEYEMLCILANNDCSTFEYYAMNDYSMIKHLIGYGVIVENDGKYDFKIDAVKDYLLRNNKKATLLKSKEEKWAHISVQRNNLENELRQVIKKIILITYKSEENAKEHVISKLFGSNSSKAKKHTKYSYVDLFDSRKSEIYLRNLRDLIKTNWDSFNEYFSPQDIFISSMDILNKEGRFDAHATIPDENEMLIIEAAINNINKGVNKFKSLLE